MEIDDLKIYNLAKEIGKEVWDIYNRLDWRDKKTMGDQWISAIDSIRANIAEGFGRYHFLDKNKFNYNARGSLLESIYWTELFHDRGKTTKKEFELCKSKLQALHIQLNNYIRITRKQVNH